MTWIKVCGITEPEDARAAALLGVNAVGLNFYAASPRSINPERALRIIEALPPFVSTVGVFVNYGDPDVLEDFALSLGLDAVQLHGDETPDYCSMIKKVKVIKAIRVAQDFKLELLRKYSPAAYLLDTHSNKGYGGTGFTFDWSKVAGANTFGQIILAGGLRAENVGKAIEVLRPFAVDVSSGVESEPGKKDFGLMKSFVEAVQKAEFLT